jgi:class 3 adenylate cyclase
VIQRYAGTLTQRLGDGFVALFGAPVAHEDVTVQVVQTGITLQLAISDPLQEAEKGRLHHAGRLHTPL